MNDDQIKALHRKYASDDRGYQVIYTHCKIVAEIAMDAAKRTDTPIDRDMLYQAAMLHDIGTYALYIPELETFKGRRDGYQLHTLFGAAILKEEGLPNEVVSAVRTHLLMGMTAAELQSAEWKMPYVDLLPESEMGVLLCYADRFHSKPKGLIGRFNGPEKFTERLAKDFPIQAERFARALEKYGTPDIESMAKRYDHPIG